MLKHSEITNTMMKPYSESCDQNKQPILEVIAPILASSTKVLEIGSGTGQHAVYFAKQMPHLTWYTSDCEPYLEGINKWLRDAALPNLKTPIELNVSQSEWPVQLDIDAVFTANSLHIMHQRDVVNLVEGVAQLLKPNGHFVVYGPFNYNGMFTSESNARFQQWLTTRDPSSGIKDFETVLSLAKENDMALLEDYEMPANNRILHFVKINTY